jgi:hypothetical protein
MTALKGNDVRKHRIENVAGFSKLMDRHTFYILNGVLIIYIGVLYVKLCDNAWKLVIKR